MAPHSPGGAGDDSSRFRVTSECVTLGFQLPRKGCELWTTNPFATKLGLLGSAIETSYVIDLPSSAISRTFSRQKTSESSMRRPDQSQFLRSSSKPSLRG